MSHIFLTSTLDTVTGHLANNLPFSPAGKKLAFINTAAEVETGSLSWLKVDRQALVDVGFEVTDYTITRKTLQDLESDLSSYDVLCVSGGNTFFLLEQILKSEFDKFLTKQLSKGVVYIGVSAGSVAAGADINLLAAIDDPKKAPGLEGTKGMGLVDLTIFPHWGSSTFRKDYLEKTMESAYITGQKIVLLTNDQYIRTVNGGYKIIDIRKD
jgi:dipeptidase E